MLKNTRNVKLILAISVAFSLSALDATSLSALDDPSLEERLENHEEGFIGRHVSNSKKWAKSFVVAQVQGRGHKILESQADEIGKLAQNKFRQLLLKDSSLRIVNANGEEVGLHIERANSEIVRSIVRKWTGIDPDCVIPFIPSSCTRFLFNKVENILLANFSEYIKEGAQKLTSQIAVRSLAKAWQLGEAGVERYLESSSSGIDKSDLELLNEHHIAARVENADLDNHQITALQSLVNYYTSKLKLTLYNKIEESVLYAVDSVAAQAYQSVEDRVETAVRSCFLAPLISQAPVIVPAAAYMFNSHLPSRGSKFNQIARFLIRAESSEAQLKLMAASHVSHLLGKFLPSPLAVTYEDRKNVYGTYSSHTEDDLIVISQEDAPKDISYYISQFIRNTKESAKDFSNTATDFFELMGPEGIDDSRFQEEYDGEDPTNPFPRIVSAAKAAASKVKSWFGW